MKHLFICSTPLQLINAVNIKLNYLSSNEEAILYMLDHNKLHMQMYETVLKSNIFKKVFLLQTSKYNNWIRNNSERNRMFKFLIKIFEYSFYTEISKKFIKDNNIYDKFWVSSMDFSSWILFMNFKKKNKKLELNFFEDGMGSYHLLTFKQSIMEQKLLRFFGFKGIFDEMNSLFLYEPELCIESLYPHVRLEKIPKIDNQETKNILKRLFITNKKEIENFKYKFIFFDQPILSKEILQQQIELIDFLSFLLGDKFLVKTHPRTRLPIKSLIHTSSVPLEAICLNKNVSNYIFITIYSTACITPKIMFNQEPIIIFLYKIFNLDTKLKTNIDIFIQKFKEKYNKNKIYIPSTFSEFKEIILELNKKEVNEEK